MDRATSRYRATRALEYRLQGMEYDAIAQALGFASRSGAWHAVDTCLRRRELELSELALAQMVLDLELLQSRSWKNAMAGDLGAIRQSLRAIELRTRLDERYGERKTA